MGEEDPVEMRYTKVEVMGVWVCNQVVHEGGGADWCKGTVHVRLWTYNSDHGCATPTPLMQLRLHLWIASSSPALLRSLSLPIVQLFLMPT